MLPVEIKGESGLSPIFFLYLLPSSPFLHFILLHPTFRPPKTPLLCMSQSPLLSYSLNPASFIHGALRTVGEKKVELDASLSELSFETCIRFCLAGVMCYSSLPRRHLKHQMTACDG